MPRCSWLVLILLTLSTGCDRYRTRNQGPFHRRTPQNPPASLTPPATIKPADPYTPRPDDGPRPPAPPPPPATLNPPPPPPPVVDHVPKPPATLPTRADQPPSLPDPDNKPKSAPTPEPFSQGEPARTQPSTPPKGNTGAASLVALKKLARTAADRWAVTPDYEAHLVRREVVGGKPSKAEEVVVLFRKQPMAVYMKNVGEVGKGREVLYSPARHGDKMHIATGAGDGAPLTGWRTTISPDDPRVRAKSRRSIRESGFGRPVEQFVAVVAKVEAGKLPADTLRYGGRVKRNEYGDHPFEGVEQVIHPGEDPLLPNGGTRHWFFDADPKSPSHGLPLLIVVYDASGKEQEYHQVSKVRSPANLTEDDFDPSRLGKRKK